MDKEQVLARAQEILKERDALRNTLKTLQELKGNCNLVSLRGCGVELHFAEMNEFEELNQAVVKLVAEYITDLLQQKEVVVGLMAMSIDKVLKDNQ